MPQANPWEAAFESASQSPQENPWEAAFSSAGTAVADSSAQPPLEHVSEYVGPEPLPRNGVPLTMVGEDVLGRSQEYHTQAGIQQLDAATPQQGDIQEHPVLGGRQAGADGQWQTSPVDPFLNAQEVPADPRNLNQGQVYKTIRGLRRLEGNELVSLEGEPDDRALVKDVVDEQFAEMDRLAEMRKEVRREIVDKGVMAGNGYGAAAARQIAALGTGAETRMRSLGQRGLSAAAGAVGMDDLAQSYSESADRALIEGQEYERMAAERDYQGIRGDIAQGARGAYASITEMLGPAKIGGVAGAIGEGALSSGNAAYLEAREQGQSEAVSRAYALDNALNEGLTSYAMGRVGGALTGRAGHQGLESTLSAALRNGDVPKATVRSFIKDFLKDQLAEQLEEQAVEHLANEITRSYELGNPDSWETTKQTAIQTLFAAGGANVAQGAAALQGREQPTEPQPFPPPRPETEQRDEVTPSPRTNFAENQPLSEKTQRFTEGQSAVSREVTPEELNKPEQEDDGFDEDAFNRSADLVELGEDESALQDAIGRIDVEALDALRQKYPNNETVERAYADAVADALEYDEMQREDPNLRDARESVPIRLEETAAEQEAVPPTVTDEAPFGVVDPAAEGDVSGEPVAGDAAADVPAGLDRATFVTSPELDDALRKEARNHAGEPDDLVQDAKTRILEQDDVWEKIQSPETDNPIGMAREMARNWMRGEGRKEVNRRRRETAGGDVVEDIAAQQPAQESDNPLGAEFGDRLPDGLDQLNKIERGLVVGHYQEGKKWADVGKKFGMDASMAGRKGREALEKLRGKLEGKVSPRKDAMPPEVVRAANDAGIGLDNITQKDGRWVTYLGEREAGQHEYRDVVTGEFFKVPGPAATRPPNESDVPLSVLDKSEPPQPVAPQEDAAIAEDADITAQQESEETGGDGDALIQDFQVQQVDPQKVILDPDRFQFKAGGDKKGVVDPLGGEFDPMAAGIVTLWEDKSGKLYAVNGHHRTAFAQEKSAPALNAYVLRERDGVTAEQARALGAELNIKEGQGKVEDYARFFREAQALSEKDATERGLLGRAAGKTGFMVGKFATDDLYDAFQAGRINGAKAAAISDVGRDREDLQNLGMAQAKAMSADELRHFLALMRDAPKPQKETQGDLFGFDDGAIQEMLSLSKAANAIIREKKDLLNSAVGAARRPEQAQKMGLSGVEEAQQKVDNLKDELGRWKNWTTDRSLMEEAKARAEGRQTQTAIEGFEAEAANAEANEQAARSKGQFETEQQTQGAFISGLGKDSPGQETLFDDDGLPENDPEQRLDSLLSDDADPESKLGDFFNESGDDSAFRLTDEKPRRPARRRVSQEQVAKVFPGSKITPVTDGYRVKTGKSHVDIQWAPQIDINRQAAERQLGRALSDSELSKLTAAGEFSVTLPDGTRHTGLGLIRLAEGMANERTLIHEARGHLAKQLLTPKEWKSLVDEYAPDARTDVEAEEMVARAMETAEARPAQAVWEKVKQVIRRILSSMGITETDAQDVVDLMQTAGFWNRKPASEGSPSYQLRNQELLDTVRAVAEKYKSQGVTSLSDFKQRIADKYGESKAAQISDYLEEAWGEQQSPPSQPPTQFSQAPEGTDDITSVKNAVVEETRAEMGINPLPEVTPESFQQWVDDGAAMLRDNRSLPAALVEEANKKARPWDERESAAMSLHLRSLKNDWLNATDRLRAAQESGGDVESAQQVVDSIWDAISAATDATHAAGTAAGRALVSRKINLASDYSIEALVQRAAAARGGEAPSPQDTAEIQRLSERIEELEAKVAQHVKEKEQRDADAKVQQQIFEDQDDIKRQRRKKPGKRKAKIRERLKKSFDTIKAGLMGNPPPDVATEGPSYSLDDAGNYYANEEELAAINDVIDTFVDDGASSFVEVMAGVRAELGEANADAMRDTFRQQWDQKQEQGSAPTIDIEPEDYSGLRRFARQVQRAIVESGVTARDPVVDGVHEALREIVPDITRRQTMDALSGYGQFSPLSKDAIDAAVRDINGQLQQLAKLEDMAAGEAPKKTGVERRTPSDEERQLIQQVNDAKRRGGFNVTNPEAQLKSALDAAKTAVRHRISDIEHEIQTRERIVREKTPMKADAELESLRKRRDALLEEHRKIFPPPGATQEQKIAAASKAMDRAIAQLEQDLKTGNWQKRPRPAPLSSPELDAKRARLEALREQRDALRSAANPKMTPEERSLKAYKASLKKRLADYQRRMAEGDFQRKERRKVKPDQEALDLQWQAEEAKEQFQEMEDKWRWERKSPEAKAWWWVKEGLHLRRSIRTAIDASMIGRQMGFYAFAHPLLSIKALPAMVKAARSEKGQWEIAQRISDSPNAQRYKTSKLGLTEIGRKVSNREEGYMGVLAKHVWGIAASERMYVTYMNAVRASAFDALAAVRGDESPMTVEEDRQLANFVNIASGRGNLGKFSAAAEGLALVFFAPRYVLSRFQLIFSETGKLAVDRRQSWRVKKRIASEYGRFLAGIGSFYAMTTLASALLWDDDDEDKPYIEYDPRSSDFGKVRIGELRIDPLAGLSQAMVFASKMLSGQRKSSRGEIVDIYGDDVPWGAPDVEDEIWRFLRTKFSPSTSNIVDWVTGGNVIGEKPGKVRQAVEFVAPMSTVDAYENMRHHGVPAGAALSLISMSGFSVSTYGIESDYKEASDDKKMEFAEWATKTVLRDYGKPRLDTGESQEDYQRALSSWQLKHDQAKAFLEKHKDDPIVKEATNAARRQVRMSNPWLDGTPTPNQMRNWRQKRAALTN